MDGSERTSTFLHMRLKIQESLLQGEGSGDQQARGMWRAGDNREQNRIWGGGQQAGQQPSRARSPALHAAAKPGFTWAEISLPVFQLNPHAWCQWPTHGHTERLAEQPRAQCIKITSKPQGKVPEQRQSINAMSICLFNLNKAIDT